MALNSPTLSEASTRYRPLGHRHPPYESIGPDYYEPRMWHKTTVRLPWPDGHPKHRLATSALTKKENAVHQTTFLQLGQGGVFQRPWANGGHAIHCGPHSHRFFTLDRPSDTDGEECKATRPHCSPPSSPTTATGPIPEKHPRKRRPAGAPTHVHDEPPAPPTERRRTKWSTGMEVRRSAGT